MIYQEQDLVAVAKRENNTKRNYLIVNRRQGKHIPVSPKEALEMFSALADIVKQTYGKEQLLIIGFAETATAIGAAVAVKLGQYYIQTTRENVEGIDDYFYFTEAHSHATEQKVVREDVKSVICGVQNVHRTQADSTTTQRREQVIDRIVFVEDEVTTGNTILSAIEAIETMGKAYGKKICFSVASILNGMDNTAEEIFQKKQIPLHYLVKIDHAKYPQIAEGYCGDGAYMNCRNEEVKYGVKIGIAKDSGANKIDMNCGNDEVKFENCEISDRNKTNSNNWDKNNMHNVRYYTDTINSICFDSTRSDRNNINNESYQNNNINNRYFFKEYIVNGYQNARRLQNAIDYQEACEQLCQKICAQMELPRRILVLGTEEFMYPALILAARLEEQGRFVRFHATTRSPIAVSTEPEYPLHTRYELVSMYDNKRRTFVYELMNYDAAIVISDAADFSVESKRALYKALACSGNQCIILVQWKK